MVVVAEETVVSTQEAMTTGPELIILAEASLLVPEVAANLVALVIFMETNADTGGALDQGAEVNKIPPSINLGERMESLLAEMTSQLADFEGISHPFLLESPPLLVSIKFLTSTSSSARPPSFEAGEKSLEPRLIFKDFDDPHPKVEEGKEEDNM